MNKSIWLIEALKLSVQTEEMLKNVNNSVMEYQNSVRLVMKQYEWLVSRILNHLMRIA